MNPRYRDLARHQRLGQEGAAFRQTIAAPAKSRFDYPFPHVAEGMRMTEDLRFGRDAREDGGATAIRDAAALEEHFRPLQGEFDAAGHPLGGTGSSTINSEIQTYRSDFTSGNHVFEPDGLRLQATLSGGHYDSYLRGQIDRRASGLFSGAPDQPVPVPLSAIGLRQADLDRVEIGDVVTSGSQGLAAVSGIDRQAGTLTFEALSGGPKVAYKGNFHLTFTRFAFGRIGSPEVVVNGQTRSITFDRALPSSVAIGCTIRGVQRGERMTFNPGNVAPAQVSGISEDRRTVTFDRPVHFPATLGTAGRDGILFQPGLWSGQIWSRRSYGFSNGERRLQALRIEVTMPAMSNYPGTPAFTRDAVEANIRDYPEVFWGYWPALWLFTWRPGPDGNGRAIRPGVPNPWSEIDIVELFVRQGGGPSAWTGFLHDQPYRRDVAVSRSMTRALNGGRWLDTQPSRSLQTPNAASLLMPEPIANGRRRSFGIVWSPTTVIHYMDDIPICRSDWPINTTYPHQLGINVACGSLAGANPAALMFPQRDSDATGQFMTVHSVRSWEL